jgi:hypothetical protein
MTINKPVFGKHFLKKLIIEIRHKPNLMHNQKAGPIFNELSDNFNSIQIAQEGHNQVYSLIDTTRYIRVFSSWDKMGMVMENVENPVDAKKIVKKFLGPLPIKLGVGRLIRIGVRSIYMLPFEGLYDELNQFCLSAFCKNPGLIQRYGKISDSLFSFTLSDETYKINLTIAPLSRQEIGVKVSEFKEYADTVDQVLMQDIDLFDEPAESTKPIEFIDAAIDAARMKFLSYSEIILRGGE